MAPKMWIPLCSLLIHFLTKNGCFVAAGRCYNAQNNGVDYRGTQSVTLSGLKCQKWSEQTPHAHTLIPKDHPDEGLDENYCRNPTDESGGPWCYTTDPNERWEYCLTPCTATGPGLMEVEFKDGFANATQNYQSGWTADKAFNPDPALILYAWHNGYETLPSIVWYVFQDKDVFVPVSVSFRPRQDPPDWKDMAPTMWQFVGSNDETCNRFSCWTVLCQDLSGTPYPHKGHTKYCDVDEKITTTFRCLGIRVLNNGRHDSQASLRDIRMWKKCD